MQQQSEQMESETDAIATKQQNNQAKTNSDSESPQIIDKTPISQMLKSPTVVEETPISQMPPTINEHKSTIETTTTN